MFNRLVVFGTALFACALLTATSPTAEPSAESRPADAADRATGVRRVEFRYRVSIGPLDVRRGPVDVFLPIPRSGPDQEVIDLVVDSPIDGTIETERAYGNRYWQGRVADGTTSPVVVELRAVVERKPVLGRSPARAIPSDHELERFLGPNERVVVGHEVLDPMLAEIRAETGGGANLATARAIFDWVVDNVEYKKVGSGWGNGDTFWACSARYGNCTDFHALFISLARTEGIPARFEIGFPVPESRRAGRVGGYHCWVSLYLPETGWFPIDASEAFKHPEKREDFFGGQPADRIHFTTGRDLRLGRAHKGSPLNYLVYPYLEQAGVASDAPVELDFSYRDL